MVMKMHLLTVAVAMPVRSRLFHSLTDAFAFHRNNPTTTLPALVVYQISDRGALHSGDGTSCSVSHSGSRKTRRSPF
jgi:hypothetical protein